MSGLAYSKRFVDLKPDLSDPSLVGAWGMKPANNKLVDLSRGNHNGIPGAFSVVEPTILGNFRRYLPNNGAAGSALGAANAFPLGDLTLSFWVRMDTGHATDWLINYRESSNDQWGIRCVTGNVTIFDNIDNAGASLYSTGVPSEKNIHIVAIMDSLENLLYIDNVLVGSGVLSSDNWASFAGVLYHGALTVTSFPTEGVISPLEVYSEANDQAWVTAQYLNGARAIQYKTEFGVTESEENQTGGLLGGRANPSQIKIKSGTWNISYKWIDNILAKAIKNVAAGVCSLPGSNIEGTPVEKAFGSWGGTLEKGADGNDLVIMPVADASAAWNDSSQDGYAIRVTSAEELKLQRVTNGSAVSDIISTAASYLESNVLYRWWLTRRYDGLFILYIKGGNYQEWTVVGTGTDLTHTASYYTIWDLDAGDEACYCDQGNNLCFIKMLGVVEPNQLAA